MGCSSTKLDNATYDNTPVFSLSGQRLNAKVVKVYDGDTIHCAVLINGRPQRMKVRLLHIQAPEMSDKNGSVSRDFLKSIVDNKRVILVAGAFDSFGRLLADVYCNGKNINTLMMDSGMATLYEKYEK